MFSAQPGPGSKPINVWSPFTAGQQSARSLRPEPLGSRSGLGVSGLDNGMQPLAGDLSLYRNGEALHADQVLVRGVRLP